MKGYIKLIKESLEVDVYDKKSKKSKKKKFTDPFQSLSPEVRNSNLLMDRSEVNAIVNSEGEPKPPQHHKDSPRANLDPERTWAFVKGVVEQYRWSKTAPEYLLKEEMVMVSFRDCITGNYLLHRKLESVFREHTRRFSYQTLVRIDDNAKHFVKEEDFVIGLFKYITELIFLKCLNEDNKHGKCKVRDGDAFAGCLENSMDNKPTEVSDSGTDEMQVARLGGGTLKFNSKKYYRVEDFVKLYIYPKEKGKLEEAPIPSDQCKN